jgi:putative addiction module killer protein
VAEVIRTDEFDAWLTGLKDLRSKARIIRRLDRLVQGNPVDVRPIGHGLSELRIDAGPGYRVYYLQQQEVLILLLCGGDKSSQSRDIDRAGALAQKWKSEAEDQRSNHEPKR